jgi:ribonuclease III
MDNLSDLQTKLKHSFEREEWLIEALTHRSYTNEAEPKTQDNERLEFLGDAVLEFVVTDMLFNTYLNLSEGELTQLRSSLVKADSLARIAQEIELGKYIRMSRGEETNGGRDRSNILCDAFEAVLGALYKDAGLEVVKAFVVPLLQNSLTFILDNQLHRDARSILQEKAQAELHYTPMYHVVETIGKEHERDYVIECRVGDWVIGKGQGHGKRLAAQIAARDALDRLEQSGWSEDVLAFSKQHQIALGILQPDKSE